MSQGGGLLNAGLVLGFLRGVDASLDGGIQYMF